MKKFLTAVNFGFSKPEFTFSKIGFNMFHLAESSDFLKLSFQGHIMMIYEEIFDCS